MADGFSLNVDPKFLQNLEEADKRIQKIADTMEATSKRIIKSFQDINSQGLDVFVNKMNDVNKVISSLSDKKISISNILGGKSQTAKSVDDINKLIELLNKLSQETKKTQGANKRGGLFGDMSKSVSDWQALQKQISDNEKQISKLTQSTREYESTMKRIQGGKGGVIHGGASKEYQENIKNIETLRQQNASLQQKQQLIIQNNQALQAQANLQHQLKQYNQQQGSLPEQRKADELKRMNDYYRELEKSSKRASEESIKSSEKEAKARERAERASKKQSETEAKRQQRAAQSRETQILNAYNQAMKANEATVNQRINKLAKLRQVESQLAQDEAKYSSQLSRVRSEIDRLSQANDKAAKSTKQLQSNQRNLMDTTGQLQRKLALLFSVSAIQGYISKLIDVRGEFEMQQRSLQVLLQNKDQANELWDKTVALAVKSPFRVKELVTYTKQLAAYRVEADKLFETNKMLADVSAGLGVDMNRLILAFGQVKAANYLRGTELRQFSEAGVNMLGELAQYFTELEGRAVSVGDVFERVSKRMVTFQDVNAIFQRITSESGIFYQMQEKQSETLRGMVMNFRDSMDLMLNDIGKDQDSMLKNSIRLAKEFVDNWRQFQPLMESIGVAFIAAFGVKTLAKIASGISKLFAAFAANPILLVASAVGVLAAALYSAHAATTKLQAAMREVETENTSSLEESIGLYKQLTQTINDTTKSYEERNKAMSQLENKFKDILPNQYIENDYVKQLGNNYREAEQAMFDYYNTKTREQKKARIEQQYEGDLSGTNIPDVISSVQDWLGDMVEVGNITEEMRIRLSSGVSGVINSLVEDVKSGKIASNVEEFNKELKVRLGKYAGIDLSKIWDKAYRGVDERFASIQSITSKLRDYASSLKSIKGLAYETYDQEQAAELINSEKNKLNRAIEDFKKVASLYQQYVYVIGKSDEEISKKRGEIEGDVQRIVNALITESKEYGVFIAQAAKDMKNNADKGAFDFAKVIQTIESSLYATFDDKGKLSDGLAKIAFENVSKSKFVDEAATKMITNFQETLSDKSKTLKMTDFQNTVVKAIELVTDKFGVSADKLAKFVPKYGEALSEVRNRVIAEKEMMDAAIASWDASFGTGFDISTGKMLGYTKEQISEYRIMTKVLETLATLMGNVQKGSGKRDKLMDERIKVIDDMNKKYKELNKTLSKTDSLQGAFDSYKDAFASAYGRSDVKSMTAEEFASKVLNFPNENDIVKWLDNLAKTAKNTEDKIKVELAKGEYVFDMKVRAKVEDDKKLIDQIEDMFSGYEMSIELQKLNIPPDLAKQLFNVDSLPLDGLRKNLKSRESEFIGTDQEEEYKKYLKKIDELEEKAQVERLKKYTKYLIKAQGERVKIKMDEMRQLSEIETLGFTDAQKQMATQAIQKEAQQALDKLEWEEFKDSGMYVQLFEDLEYASTKALEKMRERLLAMKGQLSELGADDLKHLYNQIEKLDEQLMKRNPYKTLIVGVDDYVKALKTSKRVEQELDKETAIGRGLKRDEASLSSQLAIEKSKYNQMVANFKVSSKDVNEQYQKVQQLEKQLALVKAQLLAQGKLTKELEEQLDGAKATRKTFEGSLSEIGGDIVEVANALPNIASNLENVFGAMSDGTKDAIDSISAIGAGVGSAIQGFASQNYIQAIQGIAQAIGEIFAIGDKSKERQIQREIKLVEDLERAYQKLEKQIDEAYSIDTLQRSGRQAKANVEAQIDSYEKMIAAEEDKKKTDHDRIKEWQLAIEDLIEQKAELDKQLVSTATGGIMDDVLSASKDFTDAWLEAFKETGDGLSGLESNFKETMLEMVKQQAAMLISQSYVDRWKKQLEQYINPTDLELSTDEARKWVNAVSTSLPQLNDALEKYFTAMQQAGVDISGSGELSGLQRGIQSVSESTAQIIEAYMASVRFYVADSNSKLTQIAEFVIGNNEGVNPILSELKTQTELVRDISTLLNSLTAPHPTQAGRGLKVIM